MIRWKALPWVLGVALLAVSLVAALRLPAPDTAGGNAGGPAAPVTAATVGGMTVLGTVDTPSGILPLYPPGVLGMPALTVKKVSVREGAAVSPGDVLVEFDAAAFAEKQEQAEHAHTAAQWTADQAAKKRDDHKFDVDRAKLGVEKAEGDLKSAQEIRQSVSDALEEALALKDIAKGDFLSEPEKAVRRKRSEPLQKADVAVRHAELAVREAKLTLQQAEAGGALLEKDVQRANAQVAAVQAQVDEARAWVEACKLKAQVAGTVEQVGVAEGMTIGPAARSPMMYLVPSGRRVVRAEIEAEFAHKIEGFLDRPVTITDAHNFNNTYPGVARRVNGAFLPKRFGGDTLVNAPPRALECTIDVTDPAPAGKPPLRPGQPVRVTFGN